MIKLTGKQFKEVKELFDIAEAHQRTISSLSIESRVFSEKAWAKIRQWYPELKEATCKFDVNSNTLEIISEPQSPQELP